METPCLGTPSMLPSHLHPIHRNPIAAPSPDSLVPPPSISDSFGDPGAVHGRTAEQTDPHGALFMVLAYLRLPELLAFQRLCRLLRDAIDGDWLLWRSIAVEPPLSGRLTDDALLSVISKAGGKLRSLALLDCWKITDTALLQVVDQNPSITKLYVPGCTDITADGVVRAVKRLSEQKGSLKHLRIHGLCNITREHFYILISILCKSDPHSDPQPFFYSYRRPLMLDIDDGRPIDVDICPKCENVRLVFDCTREDCRLMKDRWSECRGCFFCISRCEECGGCIDSDEPGESACLDLLCLECWLKLPKCDTCNRPYCKRHASSRVGYSETSGFVCETCCIYEASSSF